MLTPAQAAFLAALPQQPSRFNPYRDSEDRAGAPARGDARECGQAGAISADQAREALAERLVFARPRDAVPRAALRRDGAGGGGRRPPGRASTRRSTPSCRPRSRASSRASGRALSAHGAANVAVVVLENATGAWLAWEGSGDYFDTAHGGAINGPLAPRQPGSALKPLTYALAFEQGDTPATAAARHPDALPDGGAGRPVQPAQLRRPLPRTAARAPGARRVGERAGRRARGAGRCARPAAVLRPRRPDDLRPDGRVLRRSASRSATPKCGWPNWWARTRRSRAAAPGCGRRGTRDVAPRPSAFRSSPPQTAFWITDILSDPDAREYIFGRGGSLEFPFPVAAKTGTSQAYHDNWTIGYTREVTVGVWVGNFDRTPLRDSTGVTGAAPIFHAVMLAAERAVAGPGSLMADDAAGAAAGGPRAGRDLRAVGHAREPVLPVPRARVAAGGQRGASVQLAPRERRGIARGVAARVPRVGAAAGTAAGLCAGVGWLRPGRNGPRRPALAARRRHRRLEIVNPPAGALYSIDPTLRPEFQAIALGVVAPVAGAIEWRVDGAPVGRAPSDERLLWSLTPRLARDHGARRERPHRRTTIVVR